MTIFHSGNVLVETIMTTVEPQITNVCQTSGFIRVDGLIAKAPPPSILNVPALREHVFKSEAACSDGVPKRVESITQNSGDPRICIAVLDGPVDCSHPCFLGAELEVVPTWVNVDTNGAAGAHGTHVASIIFGKPGSAVQGIAPRCRGLIIPIFGDAPGGGVASCLQLDLARAILMAVDRGAHIINISGGQPASSGEPEPLLADAIRTCVQRNILIVAVAGNDGCECLHLPAAAQSVLSVGAANALGTPIASSNWGGVYRTQGIVALGEDVLGATPGGETSRKSGTSFATAVVSGVVGALLGLQVKTARAPDPHHVRAVLLETALQCVPLADRDHHQCLAGRLNVTEAITVIRGESNMTSISVSPLGEASVAISGEQHPPTSRVVQQEIQSAADTEIRPAEARIGAFDAPTDRAAVAPSCGGDGKCSCQSKSSCGCGGGQKSALVYALGTLGYDFGSEARRDSFIQGGVRHPFVADELLYHLDANPHDASSIIWTLNLDATPIYAIQPVGAYAAAVYDDLRAVLSGQQERDEHGHVTRKIDIVAIAGLIGGSVRLQSGQVVPVVVPPRGIFYWSINKLVESVLGTRPGPGDEQDQYDSKATGLARFLQRVYYDLRNLGVTAQERALNYSATNAFQVAKIVTATTAGGFDLDDVGVKRSPICRPEADCYDVELSFFNPSNTNIADRVFRFTVDVSDVTPVTVGEVRDWTRRA